MTTRPRLRLGRHLLPGILAVGLFGLMAAIVVSTPFGGWEGFPADASIVANIGYAMFDMHVLMDDGLAGTEAFLVSFILVAVLLDAALDASLVLARREEAGETVTALRSDATAPTEATGNEGRVETDGGVDECLDSTNSEGLSSTSSTGVDASGGDRP